MVSYGLRAAKGSPIVLREPAVAPAPHLATQAPALGAPSGPEVNTEQLLDLSRSVYSALGSQQGAVERLRNHSPVGNWAERHSLPWLNMPQVAGAWTERKKMFHGGSFLKLADDDV